MSHHLDFRIDSKVSSELHIKSLEKKGLTNGFTIDFCSLLHALSKSHDVYSTNLNNYLWCHYDLLWKVSFESNKIVALAK